jgi:hypothetical protein
MSWCRSLLMRHTCWLTRTGEVMEHCCHCYHYCHVVRLNHVCSVEKRGKQGAWGDAWGSH